MPEIEEAIDRVSAGPERKSHVMSTRETELTAYHESGHARREPIPHASRSGPQDHHHSARPAHRLHAFLPTEDRWYMTRSQFRDAVAAALGGHAAETVVFGEVSTGAGDDIERATRSSGAW